MFGVPMMDASRLCPLPEGLATPGCVYKPKILCCPLAAILTGPNLASVIRLPALMLSRTLDHVSLPSPLEERRVYGGGTKERKGGFSPFDADELDCSSSQLADLLLQFPAGKTAASTAPPTCRTAQDDMRDLFPPEMR